jgi:osmotically-inducible protein OsmY
MVFKTATFRGTEPQVETDHSTRAKLETAVSDALGVAGGIDASEVIVTAKGEDVFLDGVVGTPQEIERATAVARAISGVHSVENRISVGPAGNG